MTEPTYKTSSFCGNTACVEVARTDEAVLVRDRHGNVQELTKAQFDDLIAGIRNGELHV